jgi:hypothetical protein
MRASLLVYEGIGLFRFRASAYSGISDSGIVIKRR